jgi:membrane protein DedA with SNARE-associated domain
MARSVRWQIIALFIAINVAGAILFFAFDLGALFASPERFIDMMEDAGDLKPFAYVAAGTLAHFVMLNGPAVWAAPALFGWPIAYLYALVITLGGSFLAYALAWVFGHEAVQQHVPPRIRRFEERVEEHPVTTMLILRIVLWANPLVDVFIAMSNVSPILYLGVSLVMLALTTAIQVGIGMAAIEGMEAAERVPPEAWVCLAGAALLLFIGYRRWALQRAAARRRAAAETDATS